MSENESNKLANLKNTSQSSTVGKRNWKQMIKANDWTTFLAFQLQNILNNTENTKTQIDILIKYEALLTQCSYFSRMAYCPADIFCRITEHLDVTPNAFNNYIRAIEKIYDKLFNYKCSYDSTYIKNHDNFKEYFKASDKNVGNMAAVDSSKPIGYFIKNDERLNVYLYIYENSECKFNSEKTLFITFKGGSSIKEFLKTAASSQLIPDKLISELNREYVQPKNNRGVYSSVSTSESNNSSLSGGNGQNGNIELTEISNKAESTPSINNKSNNKAKTGEGFFSILKPSIKELCDRITDLQSNHPDFKRIIITGHSQGGGIASLFGYYLRKYKLNIIDNKPIHIITFGACCVFDAPGRNEFNKLLNIKSESPIFTLDRVTVNGDPVIKYPVDLDHPGFTLLKNMKVFKAFSETGRTNEIGELREMLGLTKGYDGNDLLLLGSFVNLFKNSGDFKVGNNHDVNLYRSKFKIPLGSDAKEQQLILKKAMPDAKDNIKELFKEIESKVANKIYNHNKQDGAGPLNFVKNKYQKIMNKKKNQSSATNEYKNQALQKMPNQINYNCYKIMTMGFCHGAYMGVSYMTVLRLPGISKNGLKARKEPTKNYTLYQKDIGGKTIVVSMSEDSYSKNTDCSTRGVPKKNKTNGNSKQKSVGNKIKNSFSGFTRLFESKSENSSEIELTNLEKRSEGQEGQKLPGIVLSKCSIL